MYFMGQEILEDKYWNDWPHASNLFVHWKGLEGADKKVSDFHRFTRDLIWLRRTYPGLTGEGLNVFHVHNGNRVIAFHRWAPGAGRDEGRQANRRAFGNSGSRLPLEIA